MWHFGEQNSFYTKITFELVWEGIDFKHKYGKFPSFLIAYYINMLMEFYIFEGNSFYKPQSFYFHFFFVRKT